MPLDPHQREHIRLFRDRFRNRFAADPRFGEITLDDRPDDSTLAMRFAVGEKLWLEMAIRPFIPQVRAGIMTEDRWISEDLETAIEESGDTMSEFVEMGFDEAGLTWKNPIVEHYMERPGENQKRFYFATALELPSLDDLGQPATFDKVRGMLEGYYESFRSAIEKAARAAG